MRSLHQQNHPIAVPLRWAFNTLSIICRTVALWVFTGLLGCWGAGVSAVMEPIGRCRYWGIWTWQIRRVCLFLPTPHSGFRHRHSPSTRPRACAAPPRKVTDVPPLSHLSLHGFRWGSQGFRRPASGPGPRISTPDYCIPGHLLVSPVFSVLEACPCWAPAGRTGLVAYNARSSQ